MKKIYLVKQNVNDNYDTYDSFVIVCDNANQARNINPDGVLYHDSIEDWRFKSSWCMPNEVKIQLIGVTDLYNENTIIIKSFNAG